jgi:uncharacterized Zn finger protein (UPF0148 family)
MIQRTCPQCGTTRYSADTLTDWCCPVCGAFIGKELSRPVSRSQEITDKIHAIKVVDDMLKAEKQNRNVIESRALLMNMQTKLMQEDNHETHS